MSKRTQASLLMLLSAASFAAMQVVIARSADRIPLFEQLLFRNLLTSFVALIEIRRLKQSPFGKTGNRKLLLLRSVAGYLGMVCLFYASAHGAQGDVAVMNKLSPFLVTLLAVAFLGEKVNGRQILALLLAMAGAVTVSNPTFSSGGYTMLIAFLSALFSGIAYTTVGALKGREEPCVTVFFFSFFSTVVTAVFMIRNFVLPSAADFAMLLLIGVFALGGQLALTYSYTMAKASEVSIFNYSGILFSMLFGLIILRQPIKPTSVLGAALVVLAGLLTMLEQVRKEKQKNLC